MPETKEMEAYAKDLQSNLESMTVEYNQKLQEFQKNFNTFRSRYASPRRTISTP